MNSFKKPELTFSKPQHMLLYKMQNTQFCGTENQHNKYYGAFSRE
jgi:hypothetical protein